MNPPFSPKITDDIKETLETKTEKSLKTQVCYECITCCFSTNDKWKYTRHAQTKSHQDKCQSAQNEHNELEELKALLRNKDEEINRLNNKVFVLEERLKVNEEQITFLKEYNSKLLMTPYQVQPTTSSTTPNEEHESQLKKISTTPSVKQGFNKEKHLTIDCKDAPTFEECLSQRSNNINLMTIKRFFYNNHDIGNPKAFQSTFEEFFKSACSTEQTKKPIQLLDKNPSRKHYYLKSRYVLNDDKLIIGEDIVWYDNHKDMEIINKIFKIEADVFMNKCHVIFKKEVSKHERDDKSNWIHAFVWNGKEGESSLDNVITAVVNNCRVEK